LYVCALIAEHRAAKNAHTIVLCNSPGLFCAHLQFFAVLRYIHVLNNHSDGDDDDDDDTTTTIDDDEDDDKLIRF